MDTTDSKNTSTTAENKAGIQALLRQGVATVTFTKKDGTERVMKCTLDPAVLPKQEIKEGEDRTKRLKTDTVVPVYDVEAMGWRSFTVRAVKRVEFTLT